MSTAAGGVPFVPGIELARRYWSDIVAPVVDRFVPAAARAAALLGTGSDVLGFDTAQSTDHGWGPRLWVFATSFSDPTVAGACEDAIDAVLPGTFAGYATRFPARDGAPVRHQVRCMTVDRFFEDRLRDPLRTAPSDDAWLTFPTQTLRELTAGAVFEDGPGDLTAARRRLRWYPDAVWGYVLACQWRRLAQEEAFVGRTEQVGDELGAAIVTGRIVRDLVRLCFLLEREWAPYSKWLGTAFARLRLGADLGPVLMAAVQADGAEPRERHLLFACEAIARAANDLGLVDPVDPTVRGFYARPFRVLDSQRFADAYLASTPLRERGWRGAVDQWVDSTDSLTS